MPDAQPKPTAAERAAVIVEAHQRTSQGMCSAEHPRDQFVDSGVPMWTPEHVVHMLAAAGLLVTAEHDAQVAAGALNDAADVLNHSSSDVIRYLANVERRIGPTTALDVIRWLRARAGRIAAGGES